MARRPIVAGNWKMNGDADFVKSVNTSLNRSANSDADIVICPPACFLPLFSAENFFLAGQNCSEHESGAHTGEVSASMIASLGCKYVVLGHSERREDQGESSELVASKTKHALSKGLTPIVCVGEPLQEREADTQNQFVSAQLAPLFATLTLAELANCVIAYEPIWAIGTGKTASPEQAQDMHAYIRNEVANIDNLIADGMRILYGGSVKPDNAQTLFAQQDIDGGLIGGASLNIDSFIAICEAAQ